MALSREDINRIHSNATATKDKIYNGADGYSYIGLQNKRLKRLEKSSEIVFTPSETIPQTNVQDALGNIETGKYYEMDFNSSVGFSISGKTHNFNRIPNIDIYTASGQKLLTGTNINYTTFDISVTFNRQQSGKIILT